MKRKNSNVIGGENMRIGIFGGSFNPPHKMHLEMAVELVQGGEIDQIIFVPTGSHYQYKSNLVEDQYRYQMLQIMSRKYDFIIVSDYELKDHVVYTYETLEYFQRKYPNDQIYFICGSDNLSYMDQWKCGKEILEKYKILVIQRETDDVNEIIRRLYRYQENIIVSSIQPRTLSSTEIRKAIRDEIDISHYVDLDVLSYIKNHQLYEE